MTGTDLADLDAVRALFREAGRVLRDSPGRRGSVDRLPGAGRLLVTGDLHDHSGHLAKIVHLAGLGRSTGHHVVLQELIHGERLINGLDFSYRMLGRVADLVLAHPGQVHPLLANHELSQLTGRGVSKGAGNSVERGSMLWPMRVTLRRVREDLAHIVGFKMGEYHHGELAPIGVRVNAAKVDP